MRRAIDQMKLTAFALGELETAERADIEARLVESPDDRRFVDDVRSTAQLLSDELARESSAGLDAIHYAAIEMRLRDPAPPAKHPHRSAVIRSRIGFAMSVAASVAIVCIVIGAVLASLFRRDNVTAVIPTTSPTNPVIIVPNNPVTVDRSSEHGIARAPIGADPFISVSQNPVSSFPLNTDSESYDDLRLALVDDRLPPPESVRIEGLINAFDYDYAGPVGNAVFAAHIEVGRCPWQNSHRLARVAIKARPGSGTVAQAVRAEVTFNPALAKSYRLLGYQNLGAGPSMGESIIGGQAVTALYEVVPIATAQGEADLLTLGIRYRQPGRPSEFVIEFPGRDGHDVQPASADFDFAAGVAEFGMLMSNAPSQGHAGFDDVIRLTRAGRGADPAGQRRQFIDLARRAKDLVG
jgi:hypothetical protein